MTTCTRASRSSCTGTAAGVGPDGQCIVHDINNAISPITLYVESLLASETT